LPATSNIYALGKHDGFSWRAVFSLARIIRVSNADVIHTHNLGNLIYGSLATLFSFRCPILHSEHGELSAGDLSPKRLLQRRLLYRCCTKVHTVSNDLKQHLIRLGFKRDRICALANGVNTTRYFPGTRTDARRQIGIDVDGPVIGIVARFISSKRHDVLFAAFEALASDWPNAQLLVVGAGGPEHPRITALAKGSPYANRIHMVGYQENPCPFYQAMDLLVLPSIVEGMSNVVLEAMSCGVPALSHTACGSAEVIEEGVNGFLADLQSSDLLIKELRIIFSSPERLKIMGEKARATVLRRFALSEMVRQFRRLYLDVASAYDRS
jgi:glycosyltransferase involved in cell wall biosynthesis